MIHLDSRYAACGRHLDSVQHWLKPAMPSEVKSLQEENQLLRERAKALTALVSDLSRMLGNSDPTT